jgi:hypothetical protein
MRDSENFCDALKKLSAIKQNDITAKPDPPEGLLGKEVFFRPKPTWGLPAAPKYSRFGQFCMDQRPFRLGEQYRSSKARTNAFSIHPPLRSKGAPVVSRLTGDTMKNIVSLLTAGFLAIFMGLTSLATASAAPVAVQAVPAASNIVQVQHKDYRRYEQRNDRKKRWERYDRRNDRFENRRDRRGYWNGHRGYREQRRGYRRHNDGYWYPLAIFRL